MSSFQNKSFACLSHPIMTPGLEMPSHDVALRSDWSTPGHWRNINTVQSVPGSCTDSANHDHFPSTLHFRSFYLSINKNCNHGNTVWSASQWYYYASNRGSNLGDWRENIYCWHTLTNKSCLMTMHECQHGRNFWCPLPGSEV